MIRNLRSKRLLSIPLLILGGLLMFFAPENIWMGALLFILGAGVEIAGLVLAHRDKATHSGE
jgi:Na+/phosphate symporter